MFTPHPAAPGSDVTPFAVEPWKPNARFLSRMVTSCLLLPEMKRPACNAAVAASLSSWYGLVPRTGLDVSAGRSSQILSPFLSCVLLNLPEN